VSDWKDWSDEEVSFLMDNYATLPAREIAEMLGRSVRAVYQKAWKLGLRKTAMIQPYTWNPSPEELGYVAGCLDCDGSINFCVRTRKDGRTCIDPRIVFYNTHRPMLERLREILGVGSIKKTIPKNPNHSVSYTLTVVGSKLYTILKTLEPYLVRKRRQARIVLEFYELRSRKPYNSLYGEEEWKLVEEMRKLNRKGGET